MINDAKQKRLKLALVIVAAFFTFRLFEVAISIAWQACWIASDLFAIYVFRYKFLVVPAVSVTAAVLVSRWLETKIDLLGHRTRIVLLIILAAMALFPMKVELQSQVIEPTPELLQRMDFDKPDVVAEPPLEEVQTPSEIEVDLTGLQLTTNELRNATPVDPANAAPNR
jgi:hypothetical protein